MGDAAGDRLSDAGSIPARSIKKGKSVNTEFYPLTRRKETIPENSDFLGTEFSVGLSLSFYTSYFRAQMPPLLDCKGRSIR